MWVLKHTRVLFINESKYFIKQGKDTRYLKCIEPRLSKILLVAEVMCGEYKSMLYCRHSFYV